MRRCAAIIRSVCIPAATFAAWRLAGLAVAFCIGLQSLVMPVQRALGGAHFHATAGAAVGDAEALETRSALAGADQDHTHGAPEAADDDHPHHHSHADVARHAHAEDHVDAVYLDEDDAAPSPALPDGLRKGASDLDGIWPSAVAALDRDPPAQPADTAEPGYRSWITVPPERPPRPLA